MTALSPAIRPPGWPASAGEAGAGSPFRRARNSGTMSDGALSARGGCGREAHAREQPHLVRRRVVHHDEEHDPHPGIEVLREELDPLPPLGIALDPLLAQDDDEGQKRLPPAVIGRHVPEIPAGVGDPVAVEPVRPVHQPERPEQIGHFAEIPGREGDHGAPLS